MVILSLFFFFLQQKYFIGLNFVPQGAAVLLYSITEDQKKVSRMM